MTARVVRRLALIAPALLVSAAMPSAAPRAAPAADKSIFVSVLDAEGRPVKDLTAEDFRLREDGVDLEIVSVKPATEPLQIVLLADTTAIADSLIRDIRTSLAACVKQVHATSPDAAISLMEFGQAAVTTVPFVTDDASLQSGINKLVGRPGAASVLLEAIIEASNNLAKRPSLRRAIVSLNIEPSNEQSREEPKKINDTMRKSVAQLWSVSLQKGGLKNATRDVVLNAVTRNTGGTREFIVGPSALETVLTRFADALTSQYEPTYKRPGSSAQVVQVGTLRQNVHLHASGFAPQ
jgi:hypothetical protein